MRLFIILNTFALVWIFLYQAIINIFPATTDPIMASLGVAGSFVLVPLIVSIIKD